MKPPPYSWPRSGPLVTRRHYYHYIKWLLARVEVGGQLIITGVEEARAPDIIRLAEKPTTMTVINPPRLTIPSRRGLMTRREHATLAAWLDKHCPPKQPVVTTASQ